MIVYWGNLVVLLMPSLLRSIFLEKVSKALDNVSIFSVTIFVFSPLRFLINSAVRGTGPDPTRRPWVSGGLDGTTSMALTPPVAAALGGTHPPVSASPLGPSFPWDVAGPAPWILRVPPLEVSRDWARVGCGVRFIACFFPLLRSGDA